MTPMSRTAEIMKCRGINQSPMPIRVVPQNKSFKQQKDQGVHSAGERKVFFKGEV